MSVSTTAWLPEGTVLHVWRLSNYADLSGRGGLIASGRWHLRGRPVVYTADHPSTAAAEVLAQVGDEFLLPAGLTCLRIAIKRSIRIETVDEASLAAGWRDDWNLCPPTGEAWLERRGAAVLRVPSAPAPGRHNFIVNPLHDAARHIEIVEIIQRPFPDWLVEAMRGVP